MDSVSTPTDWIVESRVRGSSRFAARASEAGRTRRRNFRRRGRNGHIDLPHGVGRRVQLRNCAGSESCWFDKDNPFARGNCPGNLPFHRHFFRTGSLSRAKWDQNRPGCGNPFDRQIDPLRTDPCDSLSHSSRRVICVAIYGTNRSASERRPARREPRRSTMQSGRRRKRRRPVLSSRRR